MCLAIARRRVDVAVEAWQALIDNCGIKSAQELVDPCVFTLSEAGKPKEAFIVTEMLSMALPKGNTLRISPETFQKAIRQAVVAPRESLTSSSGWVSDDKALKMRIELLEQWLDVAITAKVCSQDIFTAAAQGLYALSEWGLSSAKSHGASTTTCVDGVDQLMSLLEKMRTCNMAPSAEAYGFFISCAGFMLRDPMRVRELMSDMQKIKLEIPDSAYEALSAALAQSGEAHEAVVLLDKQRASGATVSERTVEAVVEGLVNEGEASVGLSLAQRMGIYGDGIKMSVFRGFISCGEMDKAFELYSGVHGAAPELPPKFKDFVKFLGGSD
jgi:hypothetical protein